MTAPQTYDAGVSHRIGRYSDAIRVPQTMTRSSYPALLAGASITDIVSIRQYLTREEDIKTYVAVQREVITHEPAAMLLVPTAMAWPEIHVEIEAVALVPSGR